MDLFIYGEREREREREREKPSPYKTLYQNPKIG